MLPEIDTEKKYTVTSGVLSYTAPFPLYEKTDVSVVWSVDGGAETTLTLDSDYSVDIADNGESGTVTLVEGRVPVGATLALQSAVPETQELDLSHTSDVDTEALEKELDRQVQMIQQLHDEVDRSVRVPVTSDTTPEELQEQLFTARDESQEAAKAAQAAQAAAESCRDEACECASEAAATLENAVTVIKEQEQASVEVVKNEGDEQAKLLEDIATTILISAASYNKSVSVKLTSPITNGETYTLPESMAYLVGRSQLYVSGNGVWFYKGFQYEEVGTDGVGSTQIKFLQDLAVDDVLTFALLANRVNLLTATNSGLINDADGYLKLNVDGQTVLINASGQVYVPVMVGATADKAGTAGIVPASPAGKQNKPLNGAGQWTDFLDCVVTALKDPDGNIDAAKLKQLLSNYLPLTGGTLTGSLSNKKNSVSTGGLTVCGRNADENPFIQFLHGGPDASTVTSGFYETSPGNISVSGTLSSAKPINANIKGNAPRTSNVKGIGFTGSTYTVPSGGAWSVFLVDVNAEYCAGWSNIAGGTVLNLVKNATWRGIVSRTA